jgi:hypothetical protein
VRLLASYETFDHLQAVCFTIFLFIFFLLSGIIGDPAVQGALKLLRGDGVIPSTVNEDAIAAGSML